MLVFWLWKCVVPTKFVVSESWLAPKPHCSCSQPLSRTLLNLRNSDTSTVLQSKCWRYEWCGGNAQKTGAAMECVREYFLGLNFLFTFFFKKKSESGYRADSPNRSKLTEIYFRNSPSEIRLLPSLFFFEVAQNPFFEDASKKNRLVEVRFFWRHFPKYNIPNCNILFALKPFKTFMFKLKT